MKRIIALSLLLSLMSTVVYAEEIFKTQKEKLGYAIGMNIGINMKQQQVNADAEQIAAGLKASFLGGDTLLSAEEMGTILVAYREEIEALQKKRMEEMAAAASENEKQSATFMVNNGKQEGVVTLDNGLQYKVLKSGEGASPKAETKVQVHYRGTLIDGTEFDSSYALGEPVSFPVNGVIAGWTQALQLMKEGDKWQLAIPPHLAYGERGAPPVVPPNSALVFEVELLKILE